MPTPALPRLPLPAMIQSLKLKKLMTWIGIGVTAVLTAFVWLPVAMAMLITKCTEVVGSWRWWQAYYGKWQYHEQEAMKGREDSRRHRAMMWLLAAPFWLPFVVFLAWELLKTDG